MDILAELHFSESWIIFANLWNLSRPQSVLLIESFFRVNGH